MTDSNDAFDMSKSNKAYFAIWDEIYPKEYYDMIYFIRDFRRIVRENFSFDSLQSRLSFGFQHADLSVVEDCEFFVYEMPSEEGGREIEYLYLSDYKKLIGIYQREVEHRPGFSYDKLIVSNDCGLVNRTDEKYLRRRCLFHLERFFRRYKGDE